MESGFCQGSFRLRASGRLPDLPAGTGQGPLEHDVEDATGEGLETQHQAALEVREDRGGAALLRTQDQGAGHALLHSPVPDDAAPAIEAVDVPAQAVGRLLAVASAL